MTALFLQNNLVHLLNPGEVEGGRQKGEGDKNIVKKLLSAPRIMDESFPYNCFKTVRKGQGGVALTKDNIGSKK